MFNKIRKIKCLLMGTLILLSFLTLTFTVQPVGASGTIYIRADGSIDPSTANITSLDNVTYTFTGNNNDSIVVERNNIIIDGAGYTLQGTGNGTGVDLSGRENVTVRNTQIKNFDYGIWLDSSSNNKFYHNNFIDNNQQVYISTSGYANFWDDGYPSGGNYWGDYLDVDLYSGPYQNESGSDGIWDHPYIIDADNRDNYPLVVPWPLNGTWTAPYKASAVYPGWHVNITVWFLQNIPETLNVTAYYEDKVIGNQTIELDPEARNALTFTWNLTGIEPCIYNYTGGYYIPYTISVYVNETKWYDGSIIVRKPGDANGDGKVYIGDLSLLGGSWNQAYPSSYYKWKADFNGDGHVYVGDLAILGRNWYNVYREVRIIDVDLGNKVGIIKSLQGVNDGPLSDGGRVDLSSYYSDLNVTHIRLHDVPNAVDIHQVFPDFNADPNIPENYDFSWTDRYLEAINAMGAKIIYRLGYSYEDPPVHNVPPEDYGKWASICVHIIKHYNDGWADGYHYNIQYWEIWNEPDITQFWTGTAEEYYNLYEVTARAIKAYDSSLKVGGPALAWDINFLNGFLDYCRGRGVPLDFVSWHIYSRSPYDIYLRSVMIRECLQSHGFQDVESLLTEWNIWPDGIMDIQTFRTVEAATFDASALIYLQDSPPDIATFYRGDTSFWGGLFDWGGNPFKAYYAFKAFRMLLDTPIRVFCNGSNEKGLAVIAGLSEDNQSATILISNYDCEFNSYDINVLNLPWKEGQIRYEVYILDSSHNLELVRTFSEEITSPNLLILLDVWVPSVYLIRLIKIA